MWIILFGSCPKWSHITAESRTKSSAALNIFYCVSPWWISKFYAAVIGAKTQQYLTGVWFEPPQRIECKVPTEPPSRCLALSQVTSWVLAFQTPDYGCMVGKCVQLIYRLRVVLVCCSSAGQTSFLNSFVFIVSACDSVQLCLLGALHLLRPSKEQTGLVAGTMLDRMPLDSVHLLVYI